MQITPCLFFVIHVTSDLSASDYNKGSMTKQFLKDAFVWGSILWFIGYVLGIALFFIVPTSLIGWVISPIGILMTLWVVWKKVKGDSLRYYVFLGVVWALLAIIFDYLFLVLLFKPADGYYKLDVYVYYFLTLALPILWYRVDSAKFFQR